MYIRAKINSGNSYWVYEIREFYINTNETDHEVLKLDISLNILEDVEPEDIDILEVKDEI